MLDIDPRASRVLFIYCLYQRSESSIVIRNLILLMRKLIRSRDNSSFTVSMSFNYLLLSNKPETQWLKFVFK